MMGIGELISALLAVIHFAGRLIYLGLSLSYIIGNLIVKNLMMLAELLSWVSQFGFSVFKIMVEDYILFMDDVVGKLAFLGSCLGSAAVSLGSSAQAMVFSIKYCASVLMEKICVFGEFIYKIYKCIVSIPEMVKRIVILIGSGMWLAIQIIPMGILYISSLVVYFIGRSVQESCNFVSVVVYGVKLTVMSAIENVILFF